METGCFAPPAQLLYNWMTCIRLSNLRCIKSRISWLSRTSWHLTNKSQVHGATPTTDMSWLWQCLQIWDSSRITAASCTSVFVLFLYKDLSKGKTSLGKKKKWHLHPVFVCELLSAAYTVLLCIENTWLLLISYRKSDHWHVRAPSSQWHHWLKLTLLNNTWWLLSNTAQSPMSYA